MNALAVLLGLKKETITLFDTTNGKTMAEYQRELLIKVGRAQFEKLQDLGLTLPVQLA